MEERGGPSKQIHHLRVNLWGARRIYLLIHPLENNNFVCELLAQRLQKSFSPTYVHHCQ